MFRFEFVWVALVLGIIGAFNFNFKEMKDDVSRWLKVWAITAVYYVPLIGFLFWAAMPSVVSPYLSIFSVLAVFFFISLCIAGIRMDDFPSGGAIIYLIFFLIFGFVGCSGCSIFRATDYRALIGEVTEKNWTEAMAPIDEAHIRTVNKEQAQYLADKVLGESKDILGSRYKVGKVDVCNYNGEVVWVTPLEFRGFFKWLRSKTSPGYVLVSAEDNTRKPVLVDSLKFKYLPSAYWGNNLRRYLYTHGYQGYQLREISFEIDDNGKPYFTISATKPSIGFAGPVTEKVIVLDPETGDLNEYKPGSALTWIDRIIPEEVAESYINHWGKYVHGFWNSLFSETDVVQATPYAYGADVWFVPSPDGKNFWFTGITSIASEDQALVGVMMMNTQDGKSEYYRLSGANEQTMFDAVSQALGADGVKWVPTQPIPYNIYGEFSFVVPVIGREKPILQKIAIVRASNLGVALGKDKRSALARYRQLLVAGGNTVAPTHQSEMQVVTGEILRIGQEIQEGTTVYTILIKPVPSKLFTLSSQDNPEVTIAQSRDIVTVKFLETEEEIVQVSEFDLHGVTLKKSESQTTYETQIRESEENLRKIEKTRQAKRSLENLSPKDLEELYELQKVQKK